MTEEKERSLTSKILLFAAMFGFPFLFIGYFVLGKQRFEKLQYYGVHKIESVEKNGKTSYDTTYYVVPDFSFTDHTGKTLTQNDFKGKITIVNFIYKDCPNDICPIDFHGFKMYVADEVQKNPGFKDVQILSFFAGATDTINEMNTFISDHKINTDIWHFVQGDMGQIYDTDMRTQNPWQAKDTIFGLEKVAYNMTLLLDRDLHIRGKFITSQKSETKRVTKEISILLREEEENAAKK